MTIPKMTHEFSLKHRPQDVPCTRCGWKPKAGELWPSLGGLAKRWIKENLVFGEGDFFGEPFVCMPEQTLFLYAWYEYCPNCEQWRYKDALRMEATGGGKSQFMAAIIALEFAGPPEIAPDSPNIPVAAASFEQADLVFGQLKLMLGGMDDEVTQAPLCGEFFVFDTEIKFKDGQPGRVYRVAAIGSTNEGGLPTLFVCDELHEWGDQGTNKARVHTVIGKSTAKRRMRSPDRGCGRVLNISTAGFSRETSLLGHMYDRCMKILDDPNVDPRFLVNIYQAREGLDYANAEHRRVACQDASPAAGVIWDIADRVNEWGKIENHEWIRYYANVWPNIDEDSWLKDHPQAWDHAFGTWESDPENNPWVLVVDMALRHDSVAVSRIEALPDDRYAITSRIWQARDHYGRVPHDDVWQYIRDEIHGKGFRGVVYDPRFFEVPARLLEGEGIQVIEFTQSPEQMAPSCGLAYKLILEGRVVHDGNRVLADHVKSAVAVPVERGGFVLRKNKSKRHIDGAITLCMGLRTLHSLPDRPEPLFAVG